MTSKLENVAQLLNASRCLRDVNFLDPKLNERPGLYAPAHRMVFLLPCISFRFSVRFLSNVN